MTKARAQYILDNPVIGGDFRFAFRKSCESKTKPIHTDGITEVEDREIKAVWEGLPGWSSYYDAVRSIASREERT